MSGVTAEGYTARTQQEILAEVEADQLSTIAPTLDLSADTPLGQVNGIFSRQVAKVEELVQVAYGAFDPDDAEDFLLTGLCKLSGTQRQPASYSTVDCVVTLTSGTTIQTDIHFAAVAGNPDSRWTPLSDFTAPSTGDHVVRFRAENIGKAPANAETITIIATAVVGWSFIHNPLDASGGTVADDDAALRIRRESDLAASGSSTMDGLVADIERAAQDGGTIVGLQPGTKCFENTNPGTDAAGRPPHSFEILLFDGITPDPGNNDAIAQVIWDSGKAAGIRSYGSSSGTATDSTGTAHLIEFSRVVTRPAYLTFIMTVGPDYNGTAADDELKAAVATAANAKFTTPGADVIALFIKAMPLEHVGVIDVDTLALDFSPSPTNESNLALGSREIARFDTSRITIFRTLVIP